MRGERLTRRGFLRVLIGAAGAAALGAAGYGGYRWPRSGSTASGSDAGVLRFRSRPDLEVPAVSVAGPARGIPGYILVTPKTFHGRAPGMAGEMILDTSGDLVWFRSARGTPMNLRVQTYRGEPVLTWWEGRSFQGHGRGWGHVLDTSYREIARINGRAPLYPDLHEFVIGPEDTAFVTCYRYHPLDLRWLGGERDAPGYESLVLEIDIATDDIVWVWHSLDHIDVRETAMTLDIAPKDRPFDYMHINSIDVLPGGDLLVSGRNTCAVYRIDRRSGSVVWRLGGKRSDFDMGPGARFYWQHDASWAGDGLVSLFDNADDPQREPQSRGLVLALDERAMTARVVHSYTHPAHLIASSQGSMQVLGGGRAFVGWGDEPYFTLFGRRGTVLLDGRFPPDKQSYRAFLQHWSGTPAEPPAVAVAPNPPAGRTVFASWNGATEVRSWRVLAGRHPGALAPAAEALRSGFETAIAVADEGPIFVAVALDAAGRELGRSAPIRG